MCKFLRFYHCESKKGLFVKNGVILIVMLGIVVAAKIFSAKREIVAQ